jgi:hypothetical protein
MNQILQRIRQDIAKSPPPWSFTDRPPPPLARWIQKECEKDSEFDSLRLRHRVVHSPRGKTLYATCSYGSVAVFYVEGEIDPLRDIPWTLWGRILRLFYAKHPITIYFLASLSPRQFPSAHSPIRPENINGGYTYPCRSDTIVLYRAEDATRVLIHELQHACCLDHPERGVDQVEAETEAWAELLYTAFLSMGSEEKWKRLWSRQWKWIQHQNQQVARHMRSPLSKEFPWRYTLGKEQVLRDWFPFLSASPLQASLISSSLTSLRLTAPPTLPQKREQGVRSSSTVL